MAEKIEALDSSADEPVKKTFEVQNVDIWKFTLEALRNTIGDDCTGMEPLRELEALRGIPSPKPRYLPAIFMGLNEVGAGVCKLYLE